jgi:hypothetical protein
MESFPSNHFYPSPCHRNGNVEGERGIMVLWAAAPTPYFATDTMERLSESYARGLIGAESFGLRSARCVLVEAVGEIDARLASIPKRLATPPHRTGSNRVRRGGI